MPKAIFYMIWKSILAGKDISVVIKNLSKNGEYYWLTTDILVEHNDKGDLRSFNSYSRIAPTHVSNLFEDLYKNMILAEKRGGIDESLRYLETFLEQKQMSYDKFLEDLAKPKGVLNILIDNFKKVLN